MELIQQLSQELKLRPAQVEAAVRLLDEGNTIPFIARYRKEMTDSLDDAALRDLSDRLEYLRNLQKRREEVLRSITEQEKLTPELEAAVNAATAGPAAALHGKKDWSRWQRRSAPRIRCRSRFPWRKNILTPKRA